jgi:hypothetical protein
MSWKVGLVLVVLLVVIAGGGVLGYLFWDNLFAPDASPEEKEAMSKWLNEKWVKTEPIEVVKAKRIENSAVKKAREKYPTLDIVDCTFTYKDSLGKVDNYVHHFYFLDGKIIEDKGNSFHDVHKSDRDQAASIIEVVNRAQGLVPREGAPGGRR